MCSAQACPGGIHGVWYASANTAVWSSSAENASAFKIDNPRGSECLAWSGATGVPEPFAPLLSTCFDSLSGAQDEIPRFAGELEG